MHKSKPLTFASASRLMAVWATACVLVSCGGGGGGTNADSITVSGKAEYESVPNNPATGALNYGAATFRPIRQATVQLIDGAGNVLGSAVTSDDGAYSVTGANPNAAVRVRVRAESVRTGSTGGAWDVRVLDNTSGNALYVLDSAAFTPEATNARDLRAASGWGGSSYTGARTAAPFAVLDVAVTATQKVLSVSLDQNFPALRMHWSSNNIPAPRQSNETPDAALAAGRIGTSFFSDSGDTRQIYLLGAANEDTDEYDRHVVAHEWGHYFQSALSRDDSLGGDHGPNDKLDMRVAFSEGWGNAWSGIALGDPIYSDSLPPAAAGGFSFDVSAAPVLNRGWFSEASVQYLLWQYANTQAVGFGALFEVLTGAPLRTSSALVGIHQVSALLKEARPAAAGAIDALLTNQDIKVNDGLGSGELNSGGGVIELPIYGAYNSGTQTICVNDNAGGPNKLGNFVYRRITASGNRTLRLTTVGSATGSDPDMLLVRADGTSQAFESTTAGSESGATNLPAGTHTVVLFDYEFNRSASTIGQRCFNFSVQ
jgi:hypothetical protein